MKNIIICLIILVLLTSCQQVSGPSFDDDYMHPNEGEGERITYRFYNSVLNIECDSTCKVSLPFCTLTTDVDSTFDFHANTVCNYKRDGIIQGLKINGYDVPVFIADTTHIDTVQVGLVRTITYFINCDTIHAI